MAFGPGGSEPPAFQIGVDIMKVEPPQRESFAQFVNIFNEQVSGVDWFHIDTSQ